MFYRDGVDEGQYESVLKNEVGPMMQVCTPPSLSLWWLTDCVAIPFLRYVCCAHASTYLNDARCSCFMQINNTTTMWWGWPWFQSDFHASLESGFELLQHSTMICEAHPGNVHTTPQLLESLVTFNSKVPASQVNCTHERFTSTHLHRLHTSLGSCYPHKVPVQQHLQRRTVCWLQAKYAG